MQEESNQLPSKKEYVYGNISRIESSVVGDNIQRHGSYLSTSKQGKSTTHSPPAQNSEIRKVIHGLHKKEPMLSNTVETLRTLEIIGANAPEDQPNDTSLHPSLPSSNTSNYDQDEAQKEEEPKLCCIDCENKKKNSQPSPHNELSFPPQTLPGAFAIPGPGHGNSDPSKRMTFTSINKGISFQSRAPKRNKFSLEQRRILWLAGILMAIITIVTAAILVVLSRVNSDCDGGSCGGEECLHGFADCDGMSSTGCEVNLLSNGDHCGSCNMPCDVGESCSNSVCVANVQRSALLSLYESTNGEKWSISAKENWGSSNECQWRGVRCTNGKVTRLDLPSSHLKGTISTEIGLLTGLTSLDLGHNNLTGPIPFALGGLAKLTRLNLDDTKLTGSIPSELGRLTNLEHLHLNENYLTGILPSDLGLLTELVALALNNNYLSGPIPSTLGSLVKLTVLKLNNNELSGAIPNVLGMLTNMKFLHLRANQLSGSLPSEISSITGLISLHVNNNELVSIPPEICDMHLSLFVGDCPPCSFGCCTNCL